MTMEDDGDDDEDDGDDDDDNCDDINGYDDDGDDEIVDNDGGGDGDDHSNDGDVNDESDWRRQYDDSGPTRGLIEFVGQRRLLVARIDPEPPPPGKILTMTVGSEDSAFANLTRLSECGVKRPVHVPVQRVCEVDAFEHPVANDHRRPH